MPRGVDVVGCDLAEGGRSCVAHEACGKHVKVGDVLLFREEVDDQGDNRLGYCLKAYLIRDGSQTCHVGYLPRRLLIQRAAFNRQFATVVEDLRHSEALYLSSRRRIQ
ncbi:hypothetical protein F441_18609 [Phytophthora nicotianae CJ01A1]|uniref:HIRAN domain-containing protein n=4 Tax=Phytophthora nicotianae TaxID=4792 RepID=W2Y2K0_PHYNI|nr:hypothetical protein PPTG_24145 [Phytophthora nicotianae INRA-310]ETO75601.1 hypothetical protein F444_08834 [Phytophthora nicotianae P1976]ETP04692.1 hypothetical protein F441_18609 [Phytophthora nicotianae CJ01A1]ETP28424.1 hypothetical protein F442_22282 [Phytophthora nicotianae P10297]ETN01128.1 hypothetical protein PPTG_24145 [Phytophthora nicotianae INRA-310]ETP31688.1 hypothetical protein F442_19469 [Phytophthora nicotianae P10297]